MRSRVFLIPMLCLMLALLTSCSAQWGSSKIEFPSVSLTTTTTTTYAATVPTDTAPILNQTLNPLTGEAGYSEAAVGKRPVAVMVNNITVSLPQYGIAAADIVYEIPVEAGITRLMAVYADYTKVPSVCSVRSCRYYYPIIAFGMDAIYCHWGSDQTIAMDTLKRLKIDRLDGGTNGWQKCYFRDAQRAEQYNPEHTGYLDGAKLPQTIEAMGFRTNTDKKPAFHFRAPGEKVGAGSTCNTAVLHFSKAYWSTFTYDAASCTYLKQHSGKPHMDSHTNTQLRFTNLFILQTEIQTRPDKYLMDVALDGGSGWYISAGTVQEITWKKANEAAPIVVYDANGSELPVNAGKSYIGLIDFDRNIELG